MVGTLVLELYSITNPLRLKTQIASSFAILRRTSRSSQGRIKKELIAKLLGYLLLNVSLNVRQDLLFQY